MRVDYVCATSNSRWFTAGRTYTAYEMAGQVMMLNDNGTPWPTAEVVLEGQATFNPAGLAPRRWSTRLRQLAGVR